MIAGFTGFEPAYATDYAFSTWSGRRREPGILIAILQQLNKEERLTVVIVTHEPVIAAATCRTITMRDGEVLSDSPAGEPGRAVLPGAGDPEQRP
jgi:ABC-type thiamine transport system ATPase subunit